jgi:hypothetical protein
VRPPPFHGEEISQANKDFNESVERWRQLFKDLKRRWLDGSRIVLGIMNGLPGLLFDLFSFIFNSY